MLQHKSSIPSEGSSLAISIIVINAVFLTLSAIALGLRVWSRSLMKLSLCFNDYAALLTWPFAAGVAADSIDIFHGGLEETEQSLNSESPGQSPSLLKGFLIADFLWIIANTLIKLSILHLFTRIFTKPEFRRLVFAVMALVISLMIGVLLILLLICRPFAKFWHPTLRGTCGNTITAILVISIINMCIDIIMISLPLPFLLWLRIPLKQKLGLIIIFGLGTVICIVSILRIVTAARFNSNDHITSIANIHIWTTLEPFLAIINACIPVILPALKRITGLGNQKPSQNGHINSFLRLRAERGNTSNVNWFEDSFPLTDIDVMENDIDVTSMPISMLHNAEALSSKIKVGSTPVVDARKDWTVVSST